jgi:O-antigen/teichoic acid export membrane protein
MVLLKIILNPTALSKRLSADSLTKKASLNAVAAALDYGARLAVGFVLNPLLVTGLGDYGYGVWQVLGRLMGYISPASGRATQALQWTIAHQQASADYEAKRRQVGSAVAVWCLFLPLLALLGGGLAWFAPVWLDAPADFSQQMRVAAALLVADLMMLNLVGVPRSVLAGENLGYKRMGLSVLLVGASGGFTALALYLHTGLIGVAAATLAATLLTGALFLQVARTAIPWFGIARPAFTAVRRFLGLSGWFLMWNLVMRLMRASDVVILGIFDSAELVTSYTLTKYMPETLIAFVAIVVFGITPGLGGIIGSGNFPKAAHIRNEIMACTWLIATVVGATILLWNPSFVQLWVGAEYDAGSMPTLLIIVMVTQFVFIRNDANIIDLSLDLRHKVLLGLVSAILSVVIAGALVTSCEMGITGLCLGFIAGRALLSVGYPWLVGRFLGVSFYTQLQSVLRPVSVTLLLLAPISSLGNLLVVRTWLSFLLSVSLTLAVVSLLAFYAGLSVDQRRRIWQRVRQVGRST